MRSAVSFFVLLFSLIACSTHAENLPFLLGGIQVNEDDHRRWTAALHLSGMNAVQTTIYAHQGPWHSPVLWYDEEAPSVLKEIRAAHRDGLHTVLIPRVALSHNEPDNRFLWHGLIYPRTDDELAEWFRRYTEFVLKWAKVAEEEGVTVFGVGSEMNSLAATLPVEDVPNLPAYYLDDEQQEDLRALVRLHEDRFTEEVRLSMGAGDVVSFDDLLRRRNLAEQAWAKIYTFDGDDDAIAEMNRRRELLTKHWRELIAAVREVYSGPLTFAANFDNYHEVAFWDALDFIGVNAYFPLRRSPSDPLTEENLTKSWSDIFQNIDGFRAEHDLAQKVIFTELGYSRYQELTVAPWTAHGFVRIWNPPDEDRLLIWAEQPLAPEERALAVRALHGAAGETLAGILYWKLSSRSSLARYEPFMLDLGLDAAQKDPLLDALRLFSAEKPVDCVALGDEAESLWNCARLDQSKALGELLQEASPNLPDVDGRTPLHLAADVASAETVELLLTHDADPEAKDRHGVTPLHLAARRGLLEIAKPLRDARGARDHRGHLPIHYAAYYGKSDVFHLLWTPRDVRSRNDDRQSLLHFAAHGGDPRILKKILERTHRVDRVDRAGRTPLFFAVEKGQVDAVRLLLEAGARVDRVDRKGLGVLHLAAAGKEERILPLLLDASIQASRKAPRLDRPDKEGNTPLHHAAGWGRLDNVRGLVAAGASTSACNREGQTPLDIARESGRKRVVEFFQTETAPNHDAEESSP